MNHHIVKLSWVCLALAAIWCCSYATRAARADDMSISHSFDGTGDGYKYEVTHEDEDPFKGLATVTVTNNGSESWGDFHFFLFSSYPTSGWSDLDNVYFTSTSTTPSGLADPSSNLSSYTWSIDNTAHTLDYTFYGNPVAPSSSVTFDFYTDNTTDQKFFGLAMYPTPVPEPATLALLGLGSLSMLIRRRR